MRVAVKCSECGEENREERKFCAHCGSRLGWICPQCGSANQPNEKFCGECGFPYGLEASQLEEMHAQFQRLIPEDLARKYRAAEQQTSGENRLVTVMFADISGFTRMSQTLSPGILVQRVNKYLGIIADAIFRREGKVNRFIGDCVLAFFGVPIAHENDPDRAILSALEVRDALSDLGIDVSIGINSGMMYFGAIGPERHTEISAYGIDIILAKRLQEVAQVGQILVSEGIYRVTRRSFEFEPLDPLTLRGIEKSAVAYEVLRELPKPEKIRGLEGLRAELIGRQKELAELKEYADRLMDGEGQIVCIFGEAGVGKSRLAMELKDYVRDKDMNWLEGRGVSLGESIGYSVFVDILKNDLKFSDKDSPTELTEKITNRMKELFPQTWMDIVPYIANLLSAKYDDERNERIKHLPPEQMQYQISSTLKDVFVALAKQKPLLLILEDLHWADELSMHLISLLMGEISNAPLMLLYIYRPDPGKEHKSSRISKQALGKCPDRYREIKLRELLPRESRQLIRSLGSLLQMENLPREFEESIVEKSGGNPLFVEEVIRSLMDSGIIQRDGERWIMKAGIDEIELPNTVQNIIMARIDRMERDLQNVLRIAAVIGKLFRHRLLQYVMQKEGLTQNLDECLLQLEDKDLVYEEQSIPEVEYSFKHASHQETLYQNVWLPERQALHQKVGEGIEEFHRDRLEEFYEELAWHYSQSNHIPKAIDYSLKAGNKVRSMYANQAAIYHFNRALELIQAQPADKKQVSLEIAASEALGDVLFTIGAHDKAEEPLSHAQSLAFMQGDIQHFSSLNGKLADLYHWRGEYNKAIEAAEAGLEALGDQIHSPEAACLLEVISRSYCAKGDLDKGRRYVEQSAQIIRQIPYFESVYKVYFLLAGIERDMGNYQKAGDLLEEMERICLEHNNEVGLARCYHGLAELWWVQYDLYESSRWLEKSLVYCERTGDAHYLMEGHLELAHHTIALDGDPEQIQTHIQQGMEIAERMARTSRVASVPALSQELGTAYLDKGDMEKAIFYIRRAIEFGPRASNLAFYLCRLERLYERNGQREAFLEFCRRTQEQMNSHLKNSLRYWHLQPASLSTWSQVAWRDPFEGPSLCGEWHWIDPKGQSNHRFCQQGVLELRTSAGNDLPSANPGAPRLVQQISGDFAMEVDLTDLTEKEYQMGGLLLCTSEGDYLSYGKGHPQVNELRLGICQRDHYEIVGRGWLPGREIHLRLERRGELVSALCSNDGENWQSCGESSFAGDGVLWCGLYVACPGNSPDSVLHFKEFRIFH